ncbi:MAG: hypothetical protein ABIG68_07625 [Acidobacteriota bacterium]
MALAFLAVISYLFFSTAWISLPGLEYDETLFVNAALGNIDGRFDAIDRCFAAIVFLISA